MAGTTKKTDKKGNGLLEMGLAKPIDPEWLAIQEQIRADIEWALAAGKGRFLVGIWALREARQCAPEELPPDVRLPQDAKRQIVQRRLHAYFPYGDFPIVIRQLKEFLSDLLKNRHAIEIAGLEAADKPQTPTLAALSEEETQADEP